jgi:diguanylate cyclase (GGDEF)-like protein/hemerythrin-like metal-binding protein/PAS domain S-box-containing protein
MMGKVQSHEGDIFRWSDGFAIGLKTVDDQHRNLVEILNRLALFHTSHAADDDLLRVFDELLKYTVYHFSTEEAFMAEHRVTEAHTTAHRRAHKEFVEIALAARKDAEGAPRDVTGPTLAFLTKWLIQHILGMDRRLGTEVRLAQEAAGVPVTVSAPPSGERTTEVLLDAIDGLYVRLGQNTNELLQANQRLQQEVGRTKQSELQLRVAATAFEAQEGILITDAEGTILRVNKAFSRITGFHAGEAIGRNPRFLNSGQQDEAFYTAMWATITGTGSWQGEIWNRRRDGEAYLEWLSITAVTADDGLVTHYVGTFTDITLRKTAEDEIKHLAFYDQLTGLANRRLMLDRLAQALTSSERHGRHGALMLIDLDNFKTLNDTLGHAVGDQLLIEAAARLKSCVREGDTVARLGGDEFVVILEDLDIDERAAVQTETVAGKIEASLRRPYSLTVSPDGDELNQRHHHCTASIGITLFRGRSIEVDELVKRADTAMYQTKSAGRNGLRFFDPAMQAMILDRATLEMDLRKAIVENQFFLHYQAQVDFAGRVIGAEALVRWQHPERGIVSPADFIPLAEETGMILPLGHWVMETVCRQLVAWANQPEMAHISVAVNVSARQFSLPNFVEQVLALMDQIGVRPDRLKLELTESLLLENAEDIITKMGALKEKGVRFSLDDFGTGYSSLSYLKRLPLDQLKIDQSFVREVLTDPNDAAIAQTIVALGQSLGLAVIAEGVETEGQRNFLASHECLAYQGYFFSRPVPADVFERFVNGANRESSTA